MKPSGQQPVGVPTKNEPVAPSCHARATVITRPVRGTVLHSPPATSRIAIESDLEVGGKVFVHAIGPGHGRMAVGRVAESRVVTLAHDFCSEGTRVWVRPMLVSAQASAS